MVEACAVRVCHPGGSMPHDFFQLERPMECRYPLPLPPGLLKGVCRFWATKVAGAFRLGVSSVGDLYLVGVPVLYASVSDSSYSEPCREEDNE